MPIESIVAQITPVQDLHGQDSPYPPGGGKNKFGGGFGTSNKYPVPNGAEVMTFSAKSTGEYDLLGRWYDSSGTSISGTDFVIVAVGNTQGTNTRNVPADAATFILYARSGGDTTTFSDVQAEVGSTATSYAPYSNECPISGWTGMNGKRTGKNLLSVSMTSRTVGGIEQSVSNDGTVSLTGTSTALYLGVVGTVKLRAGSYAVNGMKSNSFSSTLQIRVGDASGTTLATDSGSGADFVLDKDTTVACVIRIPSGKTLTTPLVVEPMIRLASDSDTTYALYSGESLSVSWQDTAGTVYGGTMTVNEDGSGELISNMASVDLGTLAWGKNTDSFGINFYSDSLRDLIKQSTGSMFVQNIICSNYKTLSWANYATPTSDMCCSQTAKQIRIRDSSLESLDYTDFKTAMSGVQFVYELAEPVKYQFENIEQLTTLIGTNNVWVDTGDVTVTYQSTTSRSEYIVGMIGRAIEVFDENTELPENTSDVLEKTIDVFDEHEVEKIDNPLLKNTIELYDPKEIDESEKPDDTFNDTVDIFD